jgi:hypothetical protein
MSDYNPQNFADMFAKPLGQKLWDFITRPDNIIRMETASHLRRVAVEPLGPILLQEFGAQIHRDRIKQLIGHMARQVLEHRGYKVDRGNVRIARKGLFTSGTRYTDGKV